MSKGIVATRQISDVSELISQIETLQSDEPTYYLLQRSDDITHWKKGIPDIAEIQTYTQGRLFGNKGEIRWKKTTDGYTLLWLTDNEIPDGFRSCGEWEMCKPQDIMLIGGGKTADWQSTRLPRELIYPIEQGQNPMVTAVQYKERHSQIIRFTRYTTLYGK